MARKHGERGAVGLPIFAGRISLDTNFHLRGVDAIRIYKQMAYDEPAATSLLFAANTLLRTDLSVVPGGSTDTDKEVAEFLETCLDDMRDSLAVKLRQLYTMIQYGYVVSEVVYKRRSGGSGSRYDDGRIGWADWSLRRQESFYRWELDKNGRVSDWTQRPAPDYALRTIPLSKAIHIVADDRDGSPEGTSALRGMYRGWRFVQNFEVLYGVALERFGTGMPVFSREDPNLKLTDAQIDELAATAGAIRQNEEAYVLEPPGIKFRFEASPGLDAENYLNAINRFRIWMLATALADFIALGTEGGSYALGKDKTELFLLALTGYQERVVSTLNRQVVPRLLKANGWVAGQGGMTEMPQFILPAVKRYDLGALGSFLSVLNTIGGLHITPEDEAQFRRMADLVDISTDELEEMHEEDEAKADAMAEQMATGGMPNADETDTGEPDAAETDEELVDDDEIVAA